MKNISEKKRYSSHLNSSHFNSGAMLQLLLLFYNYLKTVIHESSKQTNKEFFQSSINKFINYCDIIFVKTHTHIRHEKNRF